MSKVGATNRTLFLLMAQYEGASLIRAEQVCADFFAPCTYQTFLRKVHAGEIALPLVKMERSQKGSRMIHVADLAAYIEARRAEAAEELRRLRA